MERGRKGEKEGEEEERRRRGERDGEGRGREKEIAKRRDGGKQRRKSNI